MNVTSRAPRESQRAMLPRPISNAVTVDVEDYFQVAAFNHRVCRSTWDKLECRVEANTDVLLSILEQAGVRATFFVLGWIADRYPKLIQRIAAGGHELASHGYWHQLVYELTPDEFAADIRRSKDAIASATGIAVTAYRAPSFSITERSDWALGILAELGFQVDSSIFPIRGHDLYGHPQAQRKIHDIETPSGTIREFPPSVGSFGPSPVPIGGGYFRLFPLKLTMRSIDSLHQAGQPAMFYTHPWEYDPAQPRIGGVGWKSRFRHYVGLRRTKPRLIKMLQRYRFDTVSAVLGEQIELPAMECLSP